ncbi:hypothetical protein Q31b_32060 [Novipirellula aureliae]|uniref:Uncharacterized protein n=2 Tax=Novipirellula aureliae TaxID=2527966 RepID=A0A5C6DT47_9BACT|nr:hypothetical protein Q31b_32060 [Novipirellula aureliae]
MQAASLGSQVVGRVAGEVVGGVEKTIDRFEQVLQGPSSNHAAETDAVESSFAHTQRPSEGKLQSMINDFSEAVRKELESIGIAANPPVELAVPSDGDLRVTNDHPDAARIETALSGNRDILDQWRQIRNVSGVNRIIVSEASGASA